MSTLHDVIVIGAGPAGTTAATLLGRLGHDVLIIEREHFPRPHVGESLLPFCHDLLQDLGVLPEMERRFVRKPGGRFIDGQRATTWCFQEVIRDPSRLSFHVIRADFDQLLLENAISHGVHCVQGIRVLDAKDTDCVDLECNARGQRVHYRARFVIDATGRDALLATRRGWKTPRPELDRTALWSHWTGVRLTGGLERGLSVIVYLGGEKRAWMWLFPLGTDRVTAGVVIDNFYLREQRRKLEVSGVLDWRAALFDQECNDAGFARTMLAAGQRTMPIEVTTDYSYDVANPFGPNYALIGDARGFIDPIFSSGVFLSMKSAYLVAPAVHARLAGDSAANALFDRAYEQIGGAYRFVHRMIRLFYDRGSVSWAELGGGSDQHRRESAIAAGHYLLAGDFFERHDRYNRFFELLEDRAGFERYRRLVIAPKGLHDTGCNTTWDEIFGAIVLREADAIS